MSEALVAEGQDMSYCHAALLQRRGVIRVAGVDARKYLQGLITNDIAKAQDGRAIHAGLLNPQGKVLFDFFVVAANGSYLLDVVKDKSGELTKRLSFYRLRAEVDIVDEPSLAISAAWGGEPHPCKDTVVYPDPRLPELGFRLILRADTSAAELGCSPASEADYDTNRIRLGVPEGGLDYGFGEAFPHEALFDQLNGVEFAKGCYVGQEVVSRMEHRGTARRRIVPIESEATLPLSGSSIEVGNMPIGTIGSVSGASGLALVRLDRAEEALARGIPLTAAGVKLRLRQPSFAKFSVPAAALSA
jgi:folate-binding protein YgfZ